MWTNNVNGSLLIKLYINNSWWYRNIILKIEMVRDAWDTHTCTPVLPVCNVSGTYCPSVAPYLRGRRTTSIPYGTADLYSCIYMELGVPGTSVYELVGNTCFVVVWGLICRSVHYIHMYLYLLNDHNSSAKDRHVYYTPQQQISWFVCLPGKFLAGQPILTCWLISTIFYMHDRSMM